ncbi:uncharacterized protein LOC127869431 [Dreissena polymorpha]|uniref:Uncharacterized protein n=1 Tax=Dreissena polymorpha TaxID=45954 RepID=A0A9D4MHW2_DREPO|nr:uncharacterized protein LOC127869431 [Dreissena polymorpha]KAH3875591.1 hypothetical protein DPMN_038860 [Dreissena polymorpha]
MKLENMIVLQGLNDKLPVTSVFNSNESKSIENEGTSLYLKQGKSFWSSFPQTTSILHDQIVQTTITTRPSLLLTKMSNIKQRELHSPTTLNHKMISAFTIDAFQSYDKGHHDIIMAILLGIFLCVTVIVTIAIFLFCRKKNTVFMLQKCEQEDSDLEMNDINTEAESSTDDSEYESLHSVSSDGGHQSRSRSRSQTYPNLNSHCVEERMYETNDQPSHKTNGTITAMRPQSTCITFVQKQKPTRSKTYGSKHYISFEAKNRNENTTVPLLAGTVSPSGSQELQTEKKITRHSLSMPIIHKNAEKSNSNLFVPSCNENQNRSISYRGSKSSITIGPPSFRIRSFPKKLSGRHCHARVELHAVGSHSQSSNQNYINDLFLAKKHSGLQPTNKVRKGKHVKGNKMSAMLRAADQKTKRLTVPKMTTAIQCHENSLSVDKES